MPFVSAAIGAIGTVLAAGTTGAAIAKAALAIGLNLIVGKIQADRAKKAAKEASGTQFERDYGENVSRKVACGYVGIAGHDVYVNTWGNSNKELHQVYVLSDYPCDGLSRIWAGGTELILREESPGFFQVDNEEFAGRISFMFADGTQTGANSTLVNTANPAGRWTADHIGHGMCYIIAHVLYDQEKMSSFPDFFFEIRGARLYDIRKDSTAGGSGAHRWGDYSTYEFSENPIVIDYNYCRGFSWNGDLFLGMDMPPQDLPIDRYATAENICDEIVEGEARYRCSVVLDADIDHGDNIEALMLSCGGIVIDSVDGSWPLIGTEQPIVETITDDDLIIGETARFQRRRSQADLVNAVSGTYPEPSNMWSPAGYDTQSNPDQVVLDRRTRDVQLNLDTVPSKRQANQLASIYYNENRYEATADIVARPRFQTIRAGDWIRWNSARYGDRIYMVQARSIRALTSDGPRNVSLSLQERDGEIYAGAGVLPPAVALPNGDPVYLNELQDWTIVPVLATGEDGRSYPAFRMSWSPFDDVTVQAIDFQWWVKTEPGNVFSRRVDRSALITFIQEGVIGNTEYEFRHRLIADRVTNWSATQTYRSLVGGADEVVKEVLEALEGFHDFVGASLRELLDTANQNILADAEIDAGAFLETTSVRKEVTLTAQGVTAEYVHAIEVATGPGSALVQDITTLTARVTSAETNITSQATATNALTAYVNTVNGRVDTVSQDVTSLTATVTMQEGQISAQGAAQTALTTRVTAAEGNITSLSQSLTSMHVEIDGDMSSLQALLQAQITTVDDRVTSTNNAVLALNTTVGRFSAGGYFRAQTVATAEGAAATIGLSVSASGTGPTSTAALFISAKSDGTSEILMNADRVAMVSGGAKAFPFVFQDGVLRCRDLVVTWAQIETAVVGNLIVGTHNIAVGAVSQVQGTTWDGTQMTSTSFTEIASINLAHGTGSPQVILQFSGMAGASETAAWQVQLTSDGNAIKTWSSGELSTGQASSLNHVQHFIPDGAKSSTVYRVMIRRVSGTASGTYFAPGSMVLMAAKR